MKELISKLISSNINKTEEEILKQIVIPPSNELGDYSFPCFELAKEKSANPADIARQIVSQIKNISEFEEIKAVGPYVNFFINRNFLAEKTVNEILKQKDEYGSSSLGKGKKIVLDMSSPNIAKPFGIGHLRSTIIGNSLSNISSFLGFKTTKINYLGDWGTQFGKLIAGYKHFGDKEKLKKEPIKYMLNLYVRGNDEKFDEEARSWFKKLENGDKESLKLWKMFKELSLKEFVNIYKLLNIKFDVISGESFYNNKMNKMVKELDKKGLLEESEGAEVVNLEKYNLGVCLIKKADGATLYATRDLTAALDRYKKYKFSKIIYEVGQEQKLHFQQVFKILELLGYSWANDCIHVSHGLYLASDGKKFATRKGKTIFMEDILHETIELAKREILKRERISRKALEERGKKIALAAIFYGDLKNHRVNDVLFDIEKFISFEGNTGPYLLYSYARAKSILRKGKYSEKNKFNISSLSNMEKNLIFKLNNFPSVVEHSYQNLSPNIIANYAFQLAQNFNEFYHSEKVIGSEQEQFRLALVSAFAQVLKNALHLLGISVIERM